MPTTALLHVLVGVLLDAQQRVLISQRLPGRHMAGAWEFPGGKLEAGETRLAALSRELREELGIDVVHAEPLLELEHAYPDRHVRLDVWHVREFRRTPAPLEQQALRWVDAEELGCCEMLPADRPIVTAVQALLTAPDGP